jgi:hypothetical protein
MRKDHLHVTDEQLLLHDSGELAAGTDAEVHAHLQACPRCHARLAELHNRLADFTEAHLRNRTVKLPPAAGAQARLRQSLAEITKDKPEAHINAPAHSAWSTFVGRQPAALVAGIAFAACFFFAFQLLQPKTKTNSSQFASLAATTERMDEPDQRLTPGAVVRLTRSQICGDSVPVTPAVPVSLKQKVFEEYGVAPPRPDAYEVDYLITPELGGATDLRNLWPEPYQNTVWNAHVKDQLEDRLHRMVCHGEVDLATAQHDISTDWIAAYRKYFHVDHPLADSAALTVSTPGPLLPLAPRS